MPKNFKIQAFENKTLSWWYNRRNSIDMNAPYQRRGGLWSKTDKAYLIDSILNDKKKILPVAAKLEGEYNVNGLFMGVPAKLGIAGVEEVIELKLNEEEQPLFDKTIAHVEELTKKVKELLA